MRVKLLTRCEYGYGTILKPGAICEVPDDEALRLIAGGSAVSIEPESATVGAPENATRSRPKPRITR